MKVLNLYAGIGGNRKLWDDVDVTAVEIDPKIAEIYHDFFPNDKMIVGEAHQYLLDYYSEYDFIWSSPPCPSHGIIRKNSCVAKGVSKAIYPDMKLYEEIILVEGYFKGLYCIENVKSYYKPLIKPQELGRHYFWVNFIIRDKKNIEPSLISEGKIKELEIRKGFNLHKYSRIDKKTILRNCVEPELGLIILESARGKTQKTIFEVTEPLELFNQSLNTRKDEGEK